MLKVKQLRTADCVVGGFRYGAEGAAGRLAAARPLRRGGPARPCRLHLGHSRPRSKPALTARLEALIAPPGFTGDAPGGPSRWSTERSADWQPLRPELVAEVRYDHVTGDRFRHGTKFLRWRPDKAPAQCTIDQMSPPAASAGLDSVQNRLRFGLSGTIGAPMGTARQANEDDPLKSHYVYVVDDDRDVRRSLSFMLGAAEIRSHPFGSGVDFLEALPDLEPGCILLDLACRRWTASTSWPRSPSATSIGRWS